MICNGAFILETMGVELEVEIKESLEVLRKALKYTRQASSKERLQML